MLWIPVSWFELLCQVSFLFLSLPQFLISFHLNDVSPKNTEPNDCTGLVSTNSCFELHIHLCQNCLSSALPRTNAAEAKSCFQMFGTTILITLSFIIDSFSMPFYGSGPNYPNFLFIFDTTTCSCRSWRNLLNAVTSKMHYVPIITFNLNSFDHWSQTISILTKVQPKPRPWRVKYREVWV